MRTKLGIILLVVVALVAAACSSDDSGDSGDAGTTASGEGCAVDQLNLVEAGVLTIGTGEPVFEPWMVDDDPTNKQGFESAVAYAIAEKMGFSDDQVTWVRTTFDEAIAVGDKNFDFNLQQYSITEARDEAVDFSTGYYTVKQALIAYSGSGVEDATTTADLQDDKLGAAIGTTSLDYIDNVIQPTDKAAVYDTNADAKSAMDAGQVDGLVFDLPTAYFITAVEIPDATIVGQFQDPTDTPEELGLVFAEGNSLVTCVNVALEALEADGTLADLENEWLAQGGDIKTITP
jgi:polar amino acid transport system substrate-binding protein